MSLRRRPFRVCYPSVGLLAVWLAGEVPPVQAQCELQKVTASDGDVDDQFGTCVSVSGDHFVVGVRYDDDAGQGSGSAYVFRLDDGGTPSDPTDDLWMEQAKLTASDAAVLAQFGTSVSIRGDRCVVGAPAGPVDARGPGAAYVYRRDENGTPLNPGDDLWVQEAKLTASDGAEDDQFGKSVAIWGDRIVVGAVTDDHSGAASGSAYVFQRQDNGTSVDASEDIWVEVAKLTASDAALGDVFGASVSISGGWVVVGAWGDGDGGSRSGSVYVFGHDDGGTPGDLGDDDWTEAVKLTASDAAEQDLFGWSVSNDKELIVVGAWADDDGGSSSGSAYVFRRDDAGTRADLGDDFWIEEAKLLPPNPGIEKFFGSCVSISGEHVVVGAKGDGHAGVRSGAVYVFRRDANATPSDHSDDAWLEASKLVASDAGSNHFFGSGVAIDDGRLVIGATGDNDMGGRAGAAYTFAVGGPDCNDNGQPDVCDILDGTSFDDDGNGVPDECEVFVTLDIKPGSCPNPVNPGSRGVVPMALVGSDSFDVADVDVDSLSLSRSDGIGGSVAPLMGPPGPGIDVDDVATPFGGEPCACHELAGDGVDDLVLKFSTPQLVAMLELDSPKAPSMVALVLRGVLRDGTEFETSDCVLLRQRGNHTGLRIRRSSR